MPVSVSAGIGLIVRVTVPVVVSFVGKVESVAVTVSVEVPAAVGVPVIAQLLEVRPAGSPVIVQVYNPIPPFTPTLPVYGVFTVPFCGDESVNVPAGLELITMVAGPEPVFCGLLPSVAVTVTVVEPAVVGVPVMLQLEAVRPAGNAPEIVQVYGAVPPLTPIVPA